MSSVQPQALPQVQLSFLGVTSEAHWRQILLFIWLSTKQQFHFCGGEPLPSPRCPLMVVDGLHRGCRYSLTAMRHCCLSGFASVDRYLIPAHRPTRRLIRVLHVILFFGNGASGSLLRPEVQLCPQILLLSLFRIRSGGSGAIRGLCPIDL